MKRVIFRTNASPTVGFGHLMRCRALAAAFQTRGVESIMVGPERSLREATDGVLFRRWTEVTEWHGETSDATALVHLAREFNCQAAVLDDYRTGSDYQAVLQSLGLRSAKFDHLIQAPIYSDWVINATPGVSESDYAAVLNSRMQQTLCGPRYAIVRPELVESVPRTRMEPEEETVLVMFGGGDDRGAVRFVLDALCARLPRTRFIVVIGNANPNKERYSASLPELYGSQLELVIQPKDLGEIYNQSTVAVVGGGTTTFELAMYGIPMVILTIAQNQEKQAQGWHDAGCGYYVGRYGESPAQRLRTRVCELLSAETLRASMSLTARSLVDGNGSHRACNSIVGGLES